MLKIGLKNYLKNTNLVSKEFSPIMKVKAQLNLKSDSCDTSVSSK